MELNPIYSKLEYNEAVYSKKLILLTQIELLKTINIISNYKDIRKQELMLKLKLKNNMTEVKNHIARIINNSPQTDNIKKAAKIHVHISSPKQHEIKRKAHIGNQLLDIKARLDALD